MDKENEVNKFKTILLLIVLIALGGLILYGEKNTKINNKKISFSQKIINIK